jgi:hypothetical protein
VVTCPTGICNSRLSLTYRLGAPFHGGPCCIQHCNHLHVFNRCMHSRSRRARARVLLLASIASAALLALTWLGLLNEGGTFGRLSTSTWAVTFVVMLRVLQLQVSDSPAQVVSLPAGSSCTCRPSQ